MNIFINFLKNSENQTVAYGTVPTTIYSAIIKTCEMNSVKSCSYACFVNGKPYDEDKYTLRTGETVLVRKHINGAPMAIEMV